MRMNHVSLTLMLGSGFLFAQSMGGGMSGGGKGSMMAGQMGAGMMGGQMMKAEMMAGMMGTVNQMHQLMQQMSKNMQGDLGPAQTLRMAQTMEDLSGMMKNLAAQCRTGKIDEGQLKSMDQKLSKLKVSLEAKAD